MVPPPTPGGSNTARRPTPVGGAPGIRRWRRPPPTPRGREVANRQIVTGSFDAYQRPSRVCRIRAR